MNTHPLKVLCPSARIGVLMLLLLSPAGAEPREFGVIPGRSLGGVRLGVGRAAVHKIWGYPQHIRQSGALLEESWKVGADAEASVLFKHGRAVQLETISPRFATAQGVSLRSTFGKIRRKLGPLRDIVFGADPDPEYAEHAQHYYDAVGRGLAFDVGLGLRANVPDEGTPLSIIVHRRGHPVLPDISSYSAPRSLKTLTK